MILLPVGNEGICIAIKPPTGSWCYPSLSSEGIGNSMPGDKAVEASS